MVPKRILTSIIILATVLASFGQLFWPADSADSVARAESGPDLTVEAITSLPETPAIGQEVTFTVTISNRGTVTSGQCYVAYYIDDDYIGNAYVKPINPGASDQYAFTWTAETGGHNIKAVVDYRKEVSESDEGNNEKSYTLITLCPDLIIDSITWSPAEPSVGATVFFNVTVKNRGAAVASSSRVHFYLGGISRGYQDANRIYPGETQTLTFSWFAKAGAYDIKAIVDEDNVVLEMDEDNNEMTIVFSALLPDLTIDDISWSPSDPSTGDNVSFKVCVINQGSVTSDNSSVNFYVNGYYLDSAWTDRLEPGASENVTFIWVVGVGTYEIKAVVAPSGVVTESDVTNNEKTITFAPSLPDFVVPSIAWSPSVPSVGDMVTFTVTVQNQGSGDAAESRVDLQVDNFDEGYQELGKLDAGDATGVIFIWRAQPGSHQIKAIVDPWDRVPESDESNNEIVITFLTPPSDLIIEQIIWTPSEPVIGDVVTFTVTVKNQGEAGSDYAHIAYYIDDNEVSTDNLNPISVNATDNQTFSWTATAGEHLIKAFVDYKEVVEESDETNNEKTVTLTPLGPDLIIESIDWSHNDPSAGETVIFTVNIKNNGSSQADPSLVHVYIDNNLRGYQDIPEMNPGMVAARAFDWKVMAGPHVILAVVDELNLVAETNEANNKTQIAYPMPDLAFETVTWSPLDPSLGDKVALTTYVRNKGSLRAGAFQVYFCVDDNVVNYQEIPQLDAGARVTNTFEWDASIGPHTLTLLADGADAISEGDESNNLATLVFSITAPDLTIEAITWPSGEPPTSDNVVFTVTIRNQGDAKAMYSSISYYVDGQYLASGQINPLEPDAKAKETFSTWMSQAGEHTIRVVIDEGNHILESNEANNEQTVTLSTTNITARPEKESVPGASPSPVTLPLPSTKKDNKAIFFFAIAVVIFGATLIISLLREMRRQ